MKPADDPVGHNGGFDPPQTTMMQPTPYTTLISATQLQSHMAGGAPLITPLARKRSARGSRTFLASLAIHHPYALEPVATQHARQQLQAFRCH
jgi:hypothetical protein